MTWQDALQQKNLTWKLNVLARLFGFVLTHFRIKYDYIKQCCEITTFTYLKTIKPTCQFPSLETRSQFMRLFQNYGQASLMLVTFH